MLLIQAKENAALQSSLENRKKALQERRLTLEQEVNSSWAISFGALSFIFFILNNVIDVLSQWNLKLEPCDSFKIFHHLFCLVHNNALY